MAWMTLLIAGIFVVSMGLLGFSVRSIPAGASKMLFLVLIVSGIVGLKAI